MFYRVTDFKEFVLSNSLPEEFNTLSDFYKKDTNWDHCVSLSDKEMVMLLKHRQVYHKYSNRDISDDSSIPTTTSTSQYALVLGIGKYGVASGIIAGRSLYNTQADRNPNVKFFFLNNKDYPLVRDAISYFIKVENDLASHMETTHDTKAA